MDLNQTSGNHRWRGRLIKAGGDILLIFGTGLSVFTWKLFSPPSVDRQPLSKTLVSLESPERQQLLSQSKSKQDFQLLSTHRETQKRPALCGVASSVRVLNALGSKRQGYRPLTQDTFFDGQTQNIRSSYAVTFSGMTLDELAAWTSTENLWKALNTTDSSFQKTRDYLVVCQ